MQSDSERAHVLYTEPDLSPREIGRDGRSLRIILCMLPFSTDTDFFTVLSIFFSSLGSGEDTQNT